MEPFDQVLLKDKLKINPAANKVRETASKQEGIQQSGIALTNQILQTPF